MYLMLVVIMMVAVTKMYLQDLMLHFNLTMRAIIISCLHYDRPPHDFISPFHCNIHQHAQRNRTKCRARSTTLRTIRTRQVGKNWGDTNHPTNDTQDRFVDNLYSLVTPILHCQDFKDEQIENYFDPLSPGQEPIYPAFAIKHLMMRPDNNSWRPYGCKIRSVVCYAIIEAHIDVLYQNQSSHP